MEILHIYTDGGYKDRHKVGAYAYIIVKNNNIITKSSKGYIKTNNYHFTVNTMELKAAIVALNWLRSNGYSGDKYRIYLHTDSQHVQLGVDEWLEKWKLNNWKTTSNIPVTNKDLWVQLDNLISFEFQNIHFQWVQSHNGVFYNEMAHDMCTEAMKRVRIKYLEKIKKRNNDK